MGVRDSLSSGLLRWPNGIQFKLDSQNTTSDLPSFNKASTITSGLVNRSVCVEPDRVPQAPSVGGINVENRELQVSLPSAWYTNERFFGLETRAIFAQVHKNPVLYLHT